MKKVLTIICAVLMCVLASACLTACGDGKIVSAKVVSGFETTVVKGTELNTDDIVVRLAYSNNKTKDITSADLEFGDIDTSTTGTKDLSVTYAETGEKFIIKIKVVEDEADVNEIVNLSSTLWTEYLAYKKEQANKENEFYDREQHLYVGDDNTFNFRLSASGLNSLGDIVRNLKSVRTNVVVKLIEGQTQTELTGEDLAQYVSVNTINAELDFTEEAIGKIFEVTVSATNRAEGYHESQTKFTAKLHVIDGFNVYDAEDLSVYDNKYEYLSEGRKADSATSHYGFNEIHQRVATKYGLTLEDISNIQSIILQNNIVIHDEDVPAENFWQYTPSGWDNTKTNLPIVGSLINRDCEGVYYRFVESDEDFQFIGNYFGIDARNLSKAVSETSNPTETDAPFVRTEGEESSIKVMCSTLFYTTGIDFSETGRPEAEGAKITWKNINFFGNGTLNADPRNSGAILLGKFHKADVVVENTISRSFLISFLVRKYSDDYRGNRSTFLFDKCKVYENYQCHLYIAGTNDGVIVKDSEFKRANGPAIMVDYILRKEKEVDENGDEQEIIVENRCIPAYVDIINSTIESLITGQEPWLRTYGADSIVAQIQPVNAYFTGNNDMNLPDTGKSFMLNPEPGVYQMNCAVFFKSDTSDPLARNQLKGYVRFFDSWEQYKAQEDNSRNLDFMSLYTLAMFAQYSGDENIEDIRGYINNALGDAQIDPNDMFTALGYSLQVASQYIETEYMVEINRAVQEAVSTAINGLTDPVEIANAIHLAKMQAIAPYAINGWACLSNLVAERSGLTGDLLNQVTLLSYISTVQQIIDMDDDHDMPVFGLDFDSNFNWIPGQLGIADAAFKHAPFMQSHTSGGYLTMLNNGMITCIPFGGQWVGGANFFDGRYLNLYHDWGFGIIIELFPTTAE